MLSGRLQTEQIKGTPDKSKSYGAILGNQTILSSISKSDALTEKAPAMQFVKYGKFRVPSSKAINSSSIMVNFEDDDNDTYRPYYNNISAATSKALRFRKRSMRREHSFHGRVKYYNLKESAASYQRRRTEILGESAGLKFMYKHNLTPVYVPGPMHGTGIDMIGWNGSNLVIIECKGPNAKLSKNPRGKDQMSDEWIQEKINSPSCKKAIDGFETALNIVTDRNPPYEKWIVHVEATIYYDLKGKEQIHLTSRPRRIN